MCTGPPNRYRVVVGKRLTDVLTSDLSCPDEMRYVVISSFLGIVAFLGVIPVVTIFIHIYLLLLKFFQNILSGKKTKRIDLIVILRKKKCIPDCDWWCRVNSC